MTIWNLQQKTNILKRLLYQNIFFYRQKLITFFAYFSFLRADGLGILNPIGKIKKRPLTCAKSLLFYILFSIVILILSDCLTVLCGSLNKFSIVAYKYKSVLLNSLLSLFN